MLLAAASLAGCEYADGEPRPAGSSGALPSAPAASTMSAEEAARQAEVIAEVESLMGEPGGVVSLGATGGMRAGQGINTSGLLPDTGTYAVRAVCADGPGAILTVRQHGAEILSRQIECGTPYDAVVELASGQVSAALEPIGEAGQVGGAVRFAGPV
jgi:hypothetical protein